MQNKTFREALMDLPKKKLVEVITGKDMEAALGCPHDFGLDSHHGYQHCLSVGNCTACWDRLTEIPEEEKAEAKPCPVDRGKLMIGLECCRRSDPERCEDCPYNCNFIVDHYCGGAITEDALAYIGWLEERLAHLEQEGGRQ